MVLGPGRTASSLPVQWHRRHCSEHGIYLVLCRHNGRFHVSKYSAQVAYGPAWVPLGSIQIREGAAHEARHESLPLVQRDDNHPVPLGIDFCHRRVCKLPPYEGDRELQHAVVVSTIYWPRADARWMFLVARIAA